MNFVVFTYWDLKISSFRLLPGIPRLQSHNRLDDPLLGVDRKRSRGPVGVRNQVPGKIIDPGRVETEAVV